MQAVPVVKPLSWLLLCLAVWLPVACWGSDDLRFERLQLAGKAGNLSVIRVVTQDERGFIWLGGEIGLGRYDGREVRVYQADPNDPHSLSANYVSSFAVDREGVLWIGTSRGLSRYNPISDNFDQFLSDAQDEHTLSDNAVRALAVDEDNNLIVGTANGIAILDPERERFSRHYHHPDAPRGSPKNYVRAVFVDSKNRIWTGSRGNGVSLFDRTTGNFESFLHDPEDPNTPLENDVTVIAEDHQGRLWLGTYHQGISRMEADGQTFTHYQHQRSDPTSLGSNNIAHILVDSSDDIWVSTDHGGVDLYQPETNSFRRYSHDAYDLNSLSSNQPRHIYEDRRGDLWIGMFPSGVMYLDRSTTLFSNYVHKPSHSDSLSHDGILSFMQDSNGTFWVGTEDGLNAFDPKQGAFTRYFNKDSKDDRRLGPILTIEEDINGDLLLGTWAGGMHRFDVVANEVRTYYPDENDPNSIGSPFVWKILRDRNDTIWVGTETDGLNRYDRETDSFVSYNANPRSDGKKVLTHNQIWTMIEDRQGDLWIATQEGLNRFNTATEEFIHYLEDARDSTSISSNQVISLFEDSRGKIWLGTQDAGINVLDPDTGAAISLNSSHGLPSATVSSLVEDDNGDIWATTINGMAFIDRDTLEISAFYETNGLVSSNFNRDASFKDEQGKLYVGSAGGMSVFDPNNVHVDMEPPPVVITDFRISNQSVAIGASDGLLRRAITETDRLTLSHAHRMFSFDFSALSYRSPQAQEYAYMLEGFDRGWHHIGNQRTATYTNISPGNYTFRVKAANRDGTWNERGASIAMQITPPIWQTWWAYVGYALLFVFIGYMINRYKNLHIKADIYRSLSATDPLTGLYNRAGMARVTEGIFGKRTIRSGFGMLLVDIDHFKQINDTHGHDAGDRVLKDFSRLIEKNIRHGDAFARWGGEEFLLLCLHTDPEGLDTLATKLRAVVAEHVFDKEREPFRLTVSIGVTRIMPEDTFERAFKRADDALYKAKTSGRNRVVFASPG